MDVQGEGNETNNMIITWKVRVVGQASTGGCCAVLFMNGAVV